MPRSRVAALLSSVLLVACGSEPMIDAGLLGPDVDERADARVIAEDVTDAGTRRPDGTAEDAASDGPNEVGADDAGWAPFDPTAVVTCDTATITGILRPSCAEASLRVPVPERVATVLDLSMRGRGDDGTCGPYFDAPGFAEHAILLPRDPSAYPMQIILPAVTGIDPACEGCGLFLDERAREVFGEDRATAFGVAFETYHRDVGRMVFGPSEGTLLAVSVPPPWYVVSGGGGEAYPWPCIGGYQEFGIRSCVGLPYGGFGFATVDPAAPSVSAILTLVETADGLNYWDPEYGEAGCLYRGAD